ncbi:MAG: hypothetical protein AB2693_33955, partial [Candidatus Thiodiazotropha sp.]
MNKFFKMQESRDTLKMPVEHGQSSGGNESDSGIGQSFFPPDFTTEAFASTPMASEPPLEQSCVQNQRPKQLLRRWVKFVLFWIIVAATILTVHFGVEKFKKWKAIVGERILSLDHISLFYIVIGCVFLISVFVNIFCLDRNSCKLSESVMSPVPISGFVKCKGAPEENRSKHLDNSGSVNPTRDFPCRRTFSGQGADVWHDFRRYFENISKLNNWTSEYSRRTLLCCLRGQAEAFAYGLPLMQQNDLKLLLEKLEERFGPANMKDSFIADAKLRRKRKDETYREFGQAVEDLYRKAYPNNLDIVKEQAMITFLDNCHESTDFRLAVKRTGPKTIQEAVTNAMKEESLRLTEIEKPKRNFQQIYNVRGRSYRRYYRGGRRNGFRGKGQGSSTDNPSGVSGLLQQNENTSNLDSVGREKVKPTERPKTDKDKVSVQLKSNMKVSGKICGIPISWKVDTGAKKTFISLNAYKKIPYRNRPGLKPTKQKFVAANGGNLQCDGETVIEMKFGEMEVFFPVIVGGVTQSLLGEDFIRHFQCNFDHENRTFIISRGEMVDDKISAKTRCKRLARVALAETTDILPGCEMIVSAHFKDKPVNSDGILVPDAVFTVKHGLMLARSVLNSDQSSFCARILNPGKD